VRITGREKLEGLRGPVMFAPNHCLHWDNGIILMAIPLSWRWKLAVAAAADDVFGNKLNGFVSSILANAFPLAREGAIRRSLELLGARLDRKFSVLIYPEGKLTVGGPMQPFKSGTGLARRRRGRVRRPHLLRRGHAVERSDRDDPGGGRGALKSFDQRGASVRKTVLPSGSR
jgi:1-acyl-sn-glycerol-3-phosphate acyltransferase